MRAVLLLSGGLDSYTAGAMARARGYELYALTVRYGQVHAREIDAARRGGAALSVSRATSSSTSNLAAFGGSALVGDGEIPKDRELDECRHSVHLRAGPQHDLPVARARLGGGGRGARPS